MPLNILSERQLECEKFAMQWGIPPSGSCRSPPLVVSQNETKNSSSTALWHCVLSASYAAWLKARSEHRLRTGYKIATNKAVVSRVPCFLHCKCLCVVVCHSAMDCAEFAIGHQQVSCSSNSLLECFRF